MTVEQGELDFGSSSPDVVLPAARPRQRPRRTAAPAAAVVEQPVLVHVTPSPPPPPAADPEPADSGPIFQLIHRAAQELARVVDKVCARGHNHHQVLDDFLDIACATLLADEARYHRARAAYSREELEMLARGLGIVMREAGEGYHDVLGPAYMELGSKHSRAGLGQFFTPWPVALMMAEMTLGQPEPKPDGSPLTILDPACGAGVMLLAAADVVERKAPMMLALGQVAFYGQDIDSTCCRMAELNLLAHGLMKPAQVATAILTAPARAAADLQRGGPGTSADPGTSGADFSR